MKRGFKTFLVLGISALALTACAQWFYSALGEVTINGQVYTLVHGEYTDPNAPPGVGPVEEGWFYYMGRVPGDVVANEAERPYDPFRCGEAMTREECIAYLRSLPVPKDEPVINLEVPQPLIVVTQPPGRD